MDRTSRTSSSGRRKNVVKPGRIDTIIGHDRRGLRLNLGLAMTQRSFTLSSSRPGGGGGGGGGAGGGGGGGGQPGDSSEALSQSGSLSQVSQGMYGHGYPSQSQLSLSQGTPSLGGLQSDTGQQFGMSQPSPDLLAPYLQAANGGTNHGRTPSGKSSQAAQKGGGELHDTARRGASEPRLGPGSVSKAGRPVPPFRGGGSGGKDRLRGSYRTKAADGSVAAEVGTGVAEAFDRLLSEKFRAQVLSELSDLRAVVAETRAIVSEKSKEHAQALAVVRDLQQEQQTTQHLISEEIGTSKKALDLLQTTIPNAFVSLEARLRHADDNVSVIADVASEALAAARGATAAAAAAESAAISAEQAATSGKGAAVAAEAAVVQASEDSRRERDAAQLQRNAAVLQASADRLREREREELQRSAAGADVVQAQATADRLRERERGEIERNEVAARASSERLREREREELKHKVAEASANRLREQQREDLLERKAAEADCLREREREERERNASAEAAAVVQASADSRSRREQERDEIESDSSHQRRFSGSGGAVEAALAPTPTHSRRERESVELSRGGSHRRHLSGSLDGAHTAASGPVLRRDQHSRPYAGSDSGQPRLALAAGRASPLSSSAGLDELQKRHQAVASSSDDESHTTGQGGHFDLGAPRSSKRIRRSRAPTGAWRRKQPSDAGSTWRGPRRDGRYSTDKGYSSPASYSSSPTVARRGGDKDDDEKEKEDKVPLFDLDSFNPFKEDLSGSIPAAEKTSTGHPTSNQGTDNHNYYTRYSQRIMASPVRPPLSTASAPAVRAAPQRTISRGRQPTRRSVSRSRSVQPSAGSPVTRRGQAVTLQGQTATLRGITEGVERTRSSSRPVSVALPASPDSKGSPTPSWLHRQGKRMRTPPTPDTRGSSSRLHRQTLVAGPPSTSGNNWHPSLRREELRAASPSSLDNRVSPSRLHRKRLTAGSPPPSGDNGTPSWLRRQGRLGAAVPPSPESSGIPPSGRSGRAGGATAVHGGSQRDESMDHERYQRNPIVERGTSSTSASRPNPRVDRGCVTHDPPIEAASGGQRGREGPSSPRREARLWSRGSSDRGEGEDDEALGAAGVSVEAYLAKQGNAKRSNSKVGRMTAATLSQSDESKAGAATPITTDGYPAQKHQTSVSRSQSRGRAPPRKSLGTPGRSPGGETVGSVRKPVSKGRSRGRSKGRRTPTSKSDWHPGGGSSW